jgi:hypothetical protein
MILDLTSVRLSVVTLHLILQATERPLNPDIAYFMTSFPFSVLV